MMYTWVPVHCMGSHAPGCLWPPPNTINGEARTSAFRGVRWREGERAPEPPPDQSHIGWRVARIVSPSELEVLEAEERASWPELTRARQSDPR